MSGMEAAVFPNIGKDEVFPFFDKLAEVFAKEDFRYYLPDSAKSHFERRGIHLPVNVYKNRKWIGENLELLLSVGGDGSYLLAAREMADYPMHLAGIHLGDLGFLNSIAPDNLRSRLSELKSGTYRVEERLFLSACIRRKDGSLTQLPDSLNDIVVGHNKIGKMARLRLSIDGHFFQQYPADGLIISTPTGSTSYALSCGGPILSASAQNLLVVPICPHMIQNFSMVLPAESEVSVELPEREALLHISLDGNGQYEIRAGEELRIRAAHKKIRFVRFRDQDFFTTISNRLFPKITGQ